MPHKRSGCYAKRAISWPPPVATMPMLQKVVARVVKGSPAG
jgi:hypothetical protein